MGAEYFWEYPSASARSTKANVGFEELGWCDLTQEPNFGLGNQTGSAIGS